MRRWIGRLVAALVAVAGLASVPATQVLASSPITVNVFSDTKPADHTEGTTYGQVGDPGGTWTCDPSLSSCGRLDPAGPIASFTDADACPTTCQPIGDYTASVLWGDSSANTSCPSVTCAINFVSSSGTIGTYDVMASHTYKDENNCQPTPCLNVVVHVSVTDTADGIGPVPGNNAAANGIAVKDQTLNPSTPFSFSPASGASYSGSIGSFLDGNQHASLLDSDGVTPEYALTGGIDWGDGTAADTTTGMFSIGTCDGSGCIVNVSGTHTYMNSGTYTVNMTIADGLDHRALPFTSTANVANDGGTRCTSANLQPFNPTTPAGSTVALTAGAGGCSNPQFEFWAQHPSGIWYLLGTYGSLSYNWSTAGLAPGVYTVHAWAKQTGSSTTTYEAIGSSTVTLTGCTSATVSPPVLNQSPGAPIPFTASALGCPNPQFEYWVQYPTGRWYLLRRWGVSAFSWPTTGLTPGRYTVHAWANQIGASIVTYETIGTASVGLSTCTAASLSPTNPSAPAGSTVPLNASASTCASPQFEFWVQHPDLTWHLIQSWGGAMLNWNTNLLAPGSYTVHVWAKNLGDPTLTFEVLGSDTVTLTGCTTASVAPSSQSAPAGTIVNMTGSGSAGCPNPQFEYWVQYPDMTWHFGRTWGAPGWGWNTSGLRPGVYTIHAWANQIGASIATYEAIGSATVTLTGCTSATVTPSAGTDPVGTPIMFTVAPVTCSGTPVYEFWVQYPDSTWHLGNIFTASNTWTWTTTGLATGSYVIHVWVNNQGADTSYEAIGAANHSLT